MRDWGGAGGASVWKRLQQGADEGELWRRNASQIVAQPLRYEWGLRHVPQPAPRWPRRGRFSMRRAPDG